MRVLITGVCGFAGQYMSDYLKQLQNPPEVIGADVVDGAASCDSFYRLDLSSKDDVVRLIEQSMPDYIIHLAGIFGTEDHLDVYKVNVLSIVALLEAACRYVPDVVMVAVGSAAEYGHIEPDQIPVDERTFCRPVTTYGMSKLLATQIALYYYRVFNLYVMVVRPFQLIGKGITTRLAPGAFALQIGQVLSGKAEMIRVGNLETSRDFLDVRDAVEAVWALCQKPAGGQIFNLCSGRSIKMSVLLEMMLRHCGVEIKVEVDPARLRGGADIPDICGSFQKLKEHCGWSPKRSLQESISEMFT